MNKNKKTIKRILTIMFSLFYVVSAFAVAVSDNDGSAFITKAEFDSLKNDFQSQIDQYNTSIDSKIDSAISSYLAGINIAKTEEKGIIVKNWDNYTIMNGSLDNDFAYPNVSGNIAICEYRKNATTVTDEEVVTPTSSTTNTYVKIVWCYGNFSYTNSKTVNGLNLVTNVGIGNTINTDNMTWYARATNATETWTLSKATSWENNSPNGHDPGYLDALWTNQFIISQYLNLTCNGYMPSFTNTSSPYWDPTVRWYGTRNDGGQTTASDWKSGNCRSISAIPQITYDKNADGKNFIYEHLGNWKYDTEWEVSVKDVINYAVKSSNNTKRTAGWTSLVTNKSAKWSGTEIYVQGGTVLKSRPVGFKLNRDSTFSNNKSDGSANDYKIPTIGMLGSKYKANVIYQWEKLVDNDGVTVNRLTMEKGIPVFKVKENEIIEWEPKFINNKVEGTSTEPEIVLVLSYKPFTNGRMTYYEPGTQDLNDYVKFDGMDRGLFPISENKKMKIKFKAEHDGYIYAKWFPNISDSDIESKKWESTLDIENCNTYKSTKE